MKVDRAMQIDKWGKLTLATWGLTLLVMGLGAFSYAKIQADLDAAVLASAQLDAQVNALDAVALSNIQFLKMQELQAGNAIDRICESSDARQDAGLLTICSNPQIFNRVETFAPIIIAETEAAAARGAGDFSRSIAAYRTAAEELLEIEDEYRNDKDELALRQMLFLEGEAYAEYRLENINAANTRIADALSLGRDNAYATSGFVYSTHLKIICASGDRDKSARQLFDTYREDLRAAVSEAQETDRRAAEYKQFWIEFREQDLHAFETDEELKIVCDL